MRILVVSDTHGNAWALNQAILEQPSAETVVFLGDGEKEAREAAERFPEKRFVLTAGNCDFSSRLPLQGVFEAEGKRIFYSHGHLYHVKYGIDEFLWEARQNRADIALYGHTHEPSVLYEDGLYQMNPGSLGHPRFGPPTYGVIDLGRAGVAMHIAEL